MTGMSVTENWEVVLREGLSGDVVQRSKLPPLISVSTPELGQWFTQEAEVRWTSWEKACFSTVQCNASQWACIDHLLCLGWGGPGSPNTTPRRMGMNSRKGVGGIETACVLSIFWGLNLNVGYVQFITMYVKLLNDPENIRDSSGLALVPFWTTQSLKRALAIGRECTWPPGLCVLSSPGRQVSYSPH